MCICAGVYEGEFAMGMKDGQGKWEVYICMYTCIFVYTSKCIYILMYSCIHVYVCIHVYLCI